MIIAYDVLKYLPDYLNIIKEFIRILKPGGIILIDHEFCPSYWKENLSYLNYLEELKIINQYDKEDCSSFFYRPLSNLKKVTRKILFEDFINDEGAIHIHKYDHIEWNKIKYMLTPYCEIIMEKDYLNCKKANSKTSIWEKWKDKCADMRLSIYRKKYKR